MDREQGESSDASERPMSVTERRVVSRLLSSPFSARLERLLREVVTARVDERRQSRMRVQQQEITGSREQSAMPSNGGESLRTDTVGPQTESEDGLQEESQWVSVEAEEQFDSEFPVSSVLQSPFHDVLERLIEEHVRRVRARMEDDDEGSPPAFSASERQRALESRRPSHMAYAGGRAALLQQIRDHQDSAFAEEFADVPQREPARPHVRAGPPPPPPPPPRTAPDASAPFDPRGPLRWPTVQPPHRVVINARAMDSLRVGSAPPPPPPPPAPRAAVDTRQQGYAERAHAMCQGQDQDLLVRLAGQVESMQAMLIRLSNAISDKTLQNLCEKDDREGGSSCAQCPSKGSCMFCVTETVSSVCVPCGHSFACRDCMSKALERDARCPLCRTPVTMNLALFAC